MRVELVINIVIVGYVMYSLTYTIRLWIFLPTIWPSQAQFF